VIDYERALAIVYDAVDAVNRQLPPARRLRKSPETVIVGTGGALDSLALINFVLTVEEKVGDAARTTVRLLEEDMLVEHSPFRTIETLTRYIAARKV
jgi:acyl carrier protein